MKITSYEDSEEIEEEKLLNIYYKKMKKIKKEINKKRKNRKIYKIKYFGEKINFFIFSLKNIIIFLICLLILLLSIVIISNINKKKNEKN